MIVLVDLGHVYWRNWFATTSPVQAYEQTLDICGWYRREFKQTAICCDSPVTKRRDFAPSYKANRDPKPREAVDALLSVQDRVEDWGVPVLTCEGYEADDVIATLAGQADALFEEVDIISNDKDLCQLLSETCHMVAKGQRWGVDECIDRYGVPPHQMRDWLTMVGDAADNIMGCEGVGPGRATDLLRRFGSLDGVLAASDTDLLSVKKVGAKTLASIRAWDPSTARQLVTLMTDAPVNLADLWTSPQ